MAIDKITGQSITEGVVLEGTHIVIPSGTTAQRPSGPEDGYIRYNTTAGSLEFYNGNSGLWVLTNLIPLISSVNGKVNDTYNSNLKITATNVTDIVSVRFLSSDNVEIATVAEVTSNGGVFLVDIPSTVTSAVSSGDVIKIEILNDDGTPSSNVISKTVYAAPTGGTINTYTESGSVYRSHTFTSSGTWTTTYDLVVDQLLVAGGGGGAAGGGSNNEAGGGGGAGGMVVDTDRTFGAGSSPYTVTVGAGGAGRAGGTTGETGGTGNNSDISSNSVTAAQGGGGAGQQNVDGVSGGSGGGAGGIDAGESSQSGGSGTSGQGFAGGNSTQGSGDMGAGGGGKSAVGYTTNTGTGGGGQGGAGAANTFKDGTTDYYAGGGGGGSNTDGTANSDGSGNVGGIGGGGRGNTGTSGSGTDGTANTGGGGGGGYGGASTTAGNGGSGIVIIRYKTAQETI
jgi:hypothetical protein